MKILLAGAYGQVGQELYRALSAIIPANQIVCADVRPPPANIKVQIHETINVLDKKAFDDLLQKHKIT